MFPFDRRKYCASRPEGSPALGATAGRQLIAGIAVATAAALLAACSSSGSNGSSPASPASGSAGFAGAPSVTLTVEAYVPATDPVAVWLTALAKKVSADTDGTVTMKLYLNSTLVSETNAPTAIHSDSVNMGEVQAVDLDQFALGLDILQQPFLFDNDQQANAAAADPALRAAQNQALAKTGLINLTSCNAGELGIIANKPITTAAQMQGVRLRVSSGSDVQLYNGALKADETTVAIAETYEALKLGTVNAAISNPTSIVESNWQQVAKYYNEIPVEIGATDLLMNLTAFHKLNAQQQAVLLKDAAASSTQCSMLRVNSNTRAIATMKAQGTTIVTLTPAELQTFKNATKSVLDAYVDATPLAKTLYNDALKAAAAAGTS